MQTNLSSWRGLLLKALHANRSKPEAKYVQLATLDEHQHPQVRTVVFRGFHQEACLTMHSDTRSGKNHQLTRAPESSLCWYFAASREQFRFQTSIDIVTPEMTTHEDLIKEHWQNLSDAARAQYFAASPGVPFDDAHNSGPLNSNFTEPSPFFSVLIARPYFVDYLNLRTKPQTRMQFRLNSESVWEEEKVNP